LSAWLHHLKRYNNNEILDGKFQATLEKYFQHRWRNDRNALAHKRVIGLNNFPRALVLELFTSFLHANFM